MNHSCASQLNGYAWCWGKDTNGALGNGTLTNSSLPVPVKGVTNDTQMAGGGDHTDFLAQ